MEAKKRNRTKIVIAVLAALLALSVCALVGTVIYGMTKRSEDATVEVPDNLITPDAETDDVTKSDGDTSDVGETADGGAVSDTAANGNADTNGAGTDGANGGENTTVDNNDSGVNDNPNDVGGDSDDNRADTGNVDDNVDGNIVTTTTATTATNTDSGSGKRATSVFLHNERSGENVAFSVGNMFPGDSETKYYRVRVSYHGRIAVHFGVDVRDGYEKLAEVLGVKIKLLTTGEVLYDGPMCDVPEKLTHSLSAESSTTDELYYEIIAYLDTSVGNDYQNKDLVADFRWWVEEKDNLDGAPQTGRGFILLISASVIVFSVLFIILIRRREEEEEGQKNG